jgi:hypothetical protein
MRCLPDADAQLLQFESIVQRGGEQVQNDSRSRRAWERSRYFIAHGFPVT